MKQIGLLFVLLLGACAAKPTVLVGGNPADASSPVPKAAIPVPDPSKTASMPVEPKSWFEQNRAVAPRGSNLQ